MALFELDGYVASNITQYENQFGLSKPTLTNIVVDHARQQLSRLTDDDGCVEVTLDIDMVLALASRG